MSKADTITALKRSALENFSRHGFDGASLRTIASTAGVPLSAVHIYFGSKSELYIAVGQQAWNELQQERIALFRQFIAEHPGTPPRLSDLIHALAYPVVRRAMSDSEYDVAEIRIIRSVVWERDRDDDHMQEVGDEAIEFWLSSLKQICPLLNRTEIIWAYSLVVSAIYSWQLVDHRYDKFLHADGALAIEDILDDLVVFGCNGIQAMIDRRVMRDTTKRSAAR